MRILTEGFDHLDLENQVIPEISIDEYSAKTGTDDEVVTVAFTIKGEQASKDLVEWFERGYDWIMDASLSEGELKPGQHLVFVEIKRRSTVPDKICELLEDLETLTDMDIAEWKVEIDGKEYPADPEAFREHITISPHQYRVEVEQEEEINEMRVLSGLEPTKFFTEQDAEIQAFKAMAGL